MSATDAVVGYGTIFAIGNGGSPETFTTLARTTEITPPNISVADAEATDLNSDNSFQEFIAGLIDGGTVEITFNYLKGRLTTVYDILAARAKKNFRITLPDGSYWSFSAYINNLSSAVPNGEAMTCSTTFKISGEPTFTEA